MFTGIIQAIGKIVHLEPLGDVDAGLCLTLDAGALPLNNVKLGDSIAINGACMTVVVLDAPIFKVDVSAVSLNATVGLNQLGDVNLEKALCVGDALGGHLVSGHVDGVGRVVSIESVGESYGLRVAVPIELAPFVAHKGSIVIQGVSLTINEVVDRHEGAPDTRFTEVLMNLIPHTWAVTTLSQLKVGSFVNLEIDLIARYLQRSLLFFNALTK
jgi:riboflavin synthase